MRPSLHVLCLSTVLCLFLGVHAQAGAFGAGNLVVCRVGSGPGTIASSGSPVFLDEYSPTGTAIQTIALPNNGATNLVLGSTTWVGMLTRSADGRYLVLGGYNAQLPRSLALDASVPAIIARVDQQGTVDLSTQIPANSIGNSEIRCVASPDGSRLWYVTGQAHLRYTPRGSGGTDEVVSSPDGIQRVAIQDGQLYFSSSVLAPRIGFTDTKLPTGTSTWTALPGAPSASPVNGTGFFFADRDATVAGLDTLYVGDPAGVVRKFALNGSGVWEAKGTLSISSPLAITGVVGSSSVTLYLTASSGGLIQKFTDTSAFNANITGTLSTVATAASGTSFRGIALAPVAASAVRLERFDARESGAGTHLFWRTGWESENLGFHVYRLENGERIRLNPQLIPGSALNGGTWAEAGYGYAWADPALGAAYLLEDVDLHGRSTWHGPFEPRAGPATRHSAAVAVPRSAASGPARRTLSPRRPQVRAAELAGRPAVKLRIREEGWYAVDATVLHQAGVPRGVSLRSLHLFTEGREVALELSGATGNPSSIRFYALGQGTPETTERVYWLTWGGQRSAPRILRQPYAALPQGPDSFPETVELLNPVLYYPGALNGRASNFFLGPVTAAPATHSLAAPDFAAGPGLLQVDLYGFTDLPGKPDHRVRVRFNGVEAGEVTWDGRRGVTGQFALPVGLIQPQNEVELRSDGPAPDVSLVQGLRLTYPRRYRARDGYLRCRADGGTRVRLEGFAALPDVLDVTNPETPIRLEPSVRDGGVWVSTPGTRGTARVLWASEGALKTPSPELDTPSSLSSRAHRADFLVIGPAEMREPLFPLMATRAEEGWRPLWVDVQDVYDEFNWGHPSADALRHFLQHASQRWRTPPRAVLLVGDATYDPRGYLAPPPAVQVPTGEVVAGGIETASDDWLADFDEDGVPELAVGRLTARSPQEAARMVAHILAPTPSSPTALFVADRDDGFQFLGSAQRAAAALGIQSQLVSRAQYGDATRSAMLSSLSTAPLVASYSGHGNTDFWRGGLLDSSSARTLPAVSSGAVWLSMTCLTGYFWSPTLECLAEALVRSPSGAGRAVWASTAFCSAESQGRAQEAFLRAVASGATLGEAARAAKRGVYDTDVRRSFVLLGDPTARLR